MDFRLTKERLGRVFPDFPKTIDKQRFCNIFNAMADKFLYCEGISEEKLLARISHILGQMYVESRHFASAERLGRERYKKRGYLHICGKDEYSAVSSWWYGDLRLVEMPKIVSEHIEMRLVAAFWKWNTRGCNALADKDAYKDLTQILHNGQLPDYVERVISTDRIRKALRNEFCIIKYHGQN